MLAANHIELTGAFDVDPKLLGYLSLSWLSLTAGQIKMPLHMDYLRLDWVPQVGSFVSLFDYCFLGQSWNCWRYFSYIHRTLFTM